MSDYGRQIKAFFHFLFKHLFEFEFAVRVIVEILIFIVLVYIILKLVYTIIRKIGNFIYFIFLELVVPLRVRLYEKLAFSTSNPNWQDRANKIKDVYGEKSSKGKDNKKGIEKSYAGWWILTYLILVAWIIGFHYLGEEKRSNYEVFFLGESTIIACEEWTVDTLFSTDEGAIECFFHNKIEAD